MVDEDVRKEIAALERRIVDGRNALASAQVRDDRISEIRLKEELQRLLMRVAMLRKQRLDKGDRDGR